MSEDVATMSSEMLELSRRLFQRPNRKYFNSYFIHIFVHLRGNIKYNFDETLFSEDVARRWQRNTGTIISSTTILLLLLLLLHWHYSPMSAFASIMDLLQTLGLRLHFWLPNRKFSNFLL